jgi:hypothetical protein
MAKEKLDTATLEAIDEAQAQELLALRAQVESLENVIADLRTAAPAGSSVSFGDAPPDPLPMSRPEVEIGGRRYKFTLAAFIWRDARVTAEAAANDEALLSELLREAPGVLKEIQQSLISI